MNTTIEWRVRVTGKEKVDNLLTWAQEVERGLQLSEMIPETAKIINVTDAFMGQPECTLSWTTDNEMEYRDAVAS